MPKVVHNRRVHAYDTAGVGTDVLLPANVGNTRIGYRIVNFGTSRVFVNVGSDTPVIGGDDAVSDFEFFVDPGGVESDKVEDPTFITQGEMRFAWDSDAVDGDHVIVTEIYRVPDPGTYGAPPPATVF